MNEKDVFLIELKDKILKEIYSARLIDESDPTYTAARIVNEAFKDVLPDE